ncbi:MAG: hypothetical protein WC699_17960 [Bacteroidales bacterium]|jgi:hypothetical protein
MKSKNTMLFVIGLFAALCIGFLIGISVDFPKTDKSDLTGTFGKAEKFRKVQMTPKDIQLRSEILKDTSQLRSMIQGLVYFSVFTEEFNTNIETTLLAFKAQGMGSQAGEAEQLKALQEYSDFIKNNNKTLNSTIALLSGYYLKDTADLSQDVEKQLRDFSVYVNGLNQKSAVLSQAFVNLDNFMLGNKTFQEHKNVVTQLKSIRDQLLIGAVQLSSLMNNREQVGSFLNYAYGSQGDLNRILGREQLGAVMSKEQLQGQKMSKEDLQALMAGHGGLGCFMSRPDLGAGLQVVYDRSSLQFVSSRDPLAFTIGGKLGIIDAAYQMIGFVVLASDKLNIFFNNYSLQALVASQLGSTPLGVLLFGNLFSVSDLQNVFFSVDGINSFYGFLAKDNLGIII